MTEDEYYTHCEDWHRDEPVDGCVSCDVRATLLNCVRCGREWVDGQMNAVQRAPYGVDPATCDHVLFDGFDREQLCPMWAGLGQTCGDPITTPGSGHCDHHQGIVDAVEANKVYQRMVARR